MKIIIIPPRTKTGEGKYSEYLINGLIEHGYDFELLNNRIYGKQPNVKIFLGSLLLKKYVKEKDVIIHNLDNLGPFLINQDLGGAKTIQNVFDIAPLILPKIHGAIIKFNFKYTLPRILKNCDRIIVSSDATKHDIISLFETKEDKVDTIPLGIDTSFFNPMVSKEILSKYGIINNYLLYVGGDNPRKNLQNLILAYNKICKEIDKDLVLIGPINEKKIREIIKNLDNETDRTNKIILPGYIEYNDLPFLYSGASALVFPSLYEGFGFPPLEAMACHTPVIVSNNSSIPEVVGDSGVYIKDPLDPEEIAFSIVKTLENDKLVNKLIKRGADQANKFSWQKTIKKTLITYDKVI